MGFKPVLRFCLLVIIGQFTLLGINVRTEEGWCYVWFYRCKVWIATLKVLIIHFKSHTYY